MDSCKNCENAIFDKIWGEYKCLVKCHYIYHVLTREECALYKKKKESNKNDQT